MKQTDWIVIGVAAVLALGAAGAFYGTRPQPAKPAPPAAVNTKTAVPDGGDVKLATSLPGGGNAGGGAAGGGRMGGGAPTNAPGGAPSGNRGGGGKNGWSLSASGG